MSQGPLPGQPSMQPNMGMFNAEPEEYRNLIVNYIPITVEEEELRSIFEQAGEVESVKIVRDRINHQSRGYGFVKYFLVSGAQTAVNRFNGYELGNKRLKVNYAAAGKQKANPHQNNNMGAMQGNMGGYYQQGYANNFPGFQHGMPPGYGQQGADVVAAMQPQYMVPSAPQQPGPRQ